MDALHCFACGLGFVGGWLLRANLWAKEEPLPCHCNCNCAFSVPVGESSSGIYQSSIILAIVLGAVGLIANLAVAFKVSWTSSGEAKELSFVVSNPKGYGKNQQKGVFNSSKGLQITG